MALIWYKHDTNLVPIIEYCIDLPEKLFIENLNNFRLVKAKTGQK